MTTSTPPKGNMEWADGTVLTEVFKVVDGHEIKADIILPTGTKPGKHPLILAFHGGALVQGSRNYYPFLSPFLPSYALSLSALIVSADYRLLPSATSADLLSDLESLWSWTHTSLPSILSSRLPGQNHTVDLSRILVEGGSAGGFCAAHVALSHWREIRGAIIVYGMLDMGDRYYVGEKGKKQVEGKTPFGMPEGAMFTGEGLEMEMERVGKEGWCSERVTGEGERSLGTSMIYGGMFGGCFGGREGDSPVGRVRIAKEGEGEGLPPRVWLLHGVDDSMVPVESSRVFTEEVKKKGWKTELIYDEISDEPSDHGFNGAWVFGEKKLLNDRLAWITEGLLA